MMMSEGGQQDVVGGKVGGGATGGAEHGPDAPPNGSTSAGNGVASNGAEALNGPSAESRAALYNRARSMGIEHTVSMTREQLIAAIEAASDIPAHVEPENGVDADVENGHVDNGHVEAPHNGHVEAQESTEPVAPKRRSRRRRTQPAEADAVADFDAARVVTPPLVEPEEPVEESHAEEHEPEADSRLQGPPPGGHRPRTMTVWGAVRRQRFLLIVLGVLTLVVIGLSWAWLSYHKLTTDLQSSNNRVPAGVKEVLVPQGAISSSPTTILFEGVNLQEQPRGSVLLLHTDPGSHVLSTLALPPSTVVPGAETLQEALATANTQGGITLLNGVGGIRVGHVVLVNLAELAHAVDQLGGLPIQNPEAVRYQIPHGGSGTIPAGNVDLTGPLTALYLRPRVAPPPRLDAIARQTIVLKALIEKMLRPTSLAGVQALGRVLATTVATDLSESNVLDLASVRLGADRFVSCSAPPRSEFGRGELKAALAEFETPASAGAPHTTACTWRPIVAAPGGVVGSVSQEAVQNLPSILLALLTSSVTLWVFVALMLALAVRRTLRAARMPAPAFAMAGTAPYVSEFRPTVFAPEPAVEPAPEPQSAAVHVEDPLPEAVMPPVIDFGDEVEFEPPASELLASAEVETPAAPVEQHEIEPVAETLAIPVEEALPAPPEVVAEPEVAPEPALSPEAEAVTEAEPEVRPGRSRRRRLWGRRAAPPAEEAVEAGEPQDVIDVPEPVPVVEAEPVVQPQPLPQPRKQRRQRSGPMLPRITLPAMARPKPQPSPRAASGAHHQGGPSASRPNAQRSLPSSMGGMVIPALLGAAAVGLVFYVVLTVLAG
jgi:anionic cell wall polymer biosynthesis LytR-Cps2A-Psr (LCP) family protein